MSRQTRSSRRSAAAAGMASTLETLPIRDVPVPPRTTRRYQQQRRNVGLSSSQQQQQQQREERSDVPPKRPAAILRAEALMNAPTADWEYLQQAFNTPFAKSSPQQLLVVLDLNGTVLARPDRKNLKPVVKRPHVDEFLEKLLAQHKVMIWSSAQPASVEYMVAGIMDQEQRDQLAAVWNRQQLQLSPEAYREKVQVYKRLTWVWDDEQVQSSHPLAAQGQFWDQTNTILIDDSYVKATSEPFNHIEVPEFLQNMVHSEAKDPVLKKILMYVEEASYFEDVSTFVRKHPFNISEPVNSESR